MKKKLAIGIIAAALVAIATVSVVLRMKADSAAKQSLDAMVMSFIGTYKPTSSEAPIGSDDVQPQPVVVLRGDLSFEMENIPYEWMRNAFDRNLAIHSYSGTWRPGDDGDGSVVLFLTIKRIDATRSSQELTARVGLKPTMMYFEEKNGINIPQLNLNHDTAP